MTKLTVRERTVTVTLGETEAQVELPVVMMGELQLLEMALNRLQGMDGARSHNPADIFLRCAQVGVKALLAEYSKTQLRQTVRAAATAFKR